MNAGEHSRASELFLQACELPAERRAAFLDVACAGNAALRREIESLLVHDAAAPEILRPGAFRLATPPSGEPPPPRIGSFHILDELGHGGMGVVYRAEQREPIRRQVALKLIRRGIQGPEAVARFATERLALALMDHTNIARVLDAGSTEDGQPWVAMEFVEGVSITRYCDERRLELRARIELFLQVCAGVGHAHQKAIIHRDIKPSNVLVSVEDGQPVPKLIDFGIARPVDSRARPDHAWTGLGQLVGTPEYMSPEQADPGRRDVDTRSDVYSLGALLHELLTGVPPFDPAKLRDRGLEETLRRLREEDPPRPSVRIGSLPERSSSAACRSTDPRTLSRRLSGDLDLIVMKSLHKVPASRYASAADLAADLERYLNHEPVRASPPTVRYRLAKLVRRHRAGAAFAATIALLLVGFSISMWLQTRRVTRERDRAGRAAETAERALSVTRSLLEVYDPNHASSGARTSRELLDGSVARIERDLADQPLARARLLVDAAKIYRNLGVNDEARQLVERALTTLTDLAGAADPDTLRAKRDLAFLYFYGGRYDEAESLYQEALDGLRQRLGPDDLDALIAQHNLANLHTARGHYDLAERLHLDCLQRLRSRYGEDHPRTLRSANDLGVMYQASRRPETAEPLLVASLASHRRVLGDDHPFTLSAMNGLAVLQMDQGRFDEAEALYDESLTRKRRVLGENHPSTLKTLYNLACLSARRDRPEQALALLGQAVDRGYSSDRIGSDPDLAILRGRAEFEVLSARAAGH